MLVHTSAPNKKCLTAHLPCVAKSAISVWARNGQEAKGKEGPVASLVLDPS